MIFTKQEFSERFDIILTQLVIGTALKYSSCLYEYTINLGMVVCYCWYSRLVWKELYWCSRLLGLG